jgi:hypothetical protein
MFLLIQIAFFFWFGFLRQGLIMYPSWHSTHDPPCISLLSSDIIGMHHDAQPRSEKFREVMGEGKSGLEANKIQ